MQSHHLAWLQAHPERSETWLAAMLRDGFDVHHLDCDHENNDPANLVLMEHQDHIMLHRGGIRTSGLGRMTPRQPAKPRGQERSYAASKSPVRSRPQSLQYGN